MTASAARIDRHVPLRTAVCALAVVIGAGPARALGEGAAAADAVLLVGGRPEGIEMPSLDMALRARAACRLILEAKAPVLIISGQECGGKSMLKTVDIHYDGRPMSDLLRLQDRSAEKRIASGEMLAVMAYARGIGRPAIRLRPETEHAVALCKTGGFRKVLCIGDGSGPEKSAADGLKNAGVEVTFVGSYASAEEQEALLKKDCTLTDEDMASPRLRRLLADFGPAGAGGRTAYVRATHFIEDVGLLREAVRLLKAGVVGGLYVTGGSTGYIHAGEYAAIICRGFGLQPDRLVYCPLTGVRDGIENALTWVGPRKPWHMVIVGLSPADPLYRNYLAGAGRNVKFHAWAAAGWKAEAPRDGAEKVARALEEMVREVDRCVNAAGGPAERRRARERLDVIGDGEFGQLGRARRRMLTGFSCGRILSFPHAPWGWDGASEFLRYRGPYPDPLPLGPATAEIVGGGHCPTVLVKRHLMYDYGARGPWGELMDARIALTAEWWDRYPMPAAGAELQKPQGMNQPETGPDGE